MKITKKLISLSWVVFAAVASVQAQDTATDSHDIEITVPPVAILDIEPAADNTIALGFVAPTEAGLPITSSDSNSDLWLNYSAIITDLIDSYKVTVALDALYPGTDITVLAAADAGNGDGTMGGASAGTLTLTIAAQDIITGIGSSYTGDGVDNGHNLTYNAEVAGGGVAVYADYIAGMSPVEVTYTIVSE